MASLDALGSRVWSESHISVSVAVRIFLFSAVDFVTNARFLGHFRMLTLWLPILLSTIACFFFSFLSWMVFQLHAKDWGKMEGEDAIIDKVRELGIPEGNYMFPGCGNNKEMQDEAYQAKYQAGPRGVLSVLPAANMGVNLGLTMLYFLVCNCTFAYLASFALDATTDFITVFRFVATVALFTFCGAIVQHAIWFRSRIVGHLIESVAYGLIAGAIFAALWPTV